MSGLRIDTAVPESNRAQVEALGRVIHDYRSFQNERDRATRQAQQDRLDAEFDKPTPTDVKVENAMVFGYVLGLASVGAVWLIYTIAMASLR
jgi:hypothetical protein